MSAKPKVVLAAMVVLFGVVGALCFRKAPPPAAPAPATATLEVPTPAAAAAAPATPAPAVSQLLGRIDPVEVDDATGGPLDPIPAGVRPNARAGDPYQEMPAGPPWSGFEHDQASIEARMASIRSGDSGALDEAPPPRRRTHRVSDGDTLTSLALRYLGRSDRFQEIYAANQDVLSSPDVLPIGTLLKIPDGNTPPAPFTPGPMVEISSDALRAAREGAPPAPTAAGARTYRVQAHDTLSAIARHFYGDANRYRDVLEANRDKLRQPEDLREGMELIVP